MSIPEAATGFTAKVTARAHVRAWLYKSAANGQLLAREVVSADGRRVLGVSFVDTDKHPADEVAPELTDYIETDYGRTLAQSELANIVTRLALE